MALKLLTLVGAGGPWLEAQILRRLADPHILPIRNADLASGRPYIVTELAVHGDLGAALSSAGSCGLGVDDVVRLMRQACHGIARAHDLRLLHNDVKPGNLFLNAEGECEVGDFGFATLIPPGATSTAPAGATAETAAPEVAAGWPAPGTPTASVQSDVYSLGATAFWLLAGRPPLDLSAVPDTASKMAIVAAQTPPRLRDLAPHVPGYVAAAIERAMAPSTSDRFVVVQRSSPLRLDSDGGLLAVGAGRMSTRAPRLLARRAAAEREHLRHVLEQGARATQAIVTTRHLSSGRRVPGGCRRAPMRGWARAVRSTMRKLS